MDLSEFITNSGLPQEDKDLWVFVLSKLNDNQKKILEDFIEGSEENLKILTENLKAKKQAFENNDLKALEEIIGKEN